MFILYSLVNTHNEDREIRIRAYKIEKIQDSQTLSCTSDSIILVPHVSFDYSLERKTQVLCMLA